MTEFFVVSNSFAAPFFSDTDTQFAEGVDPQSALIAFAKSYSHPAGLYSAAIYASAEAYHKNEKPLARWLCNHEMAKQRATAGKGAYSYYGSAPGTFAIDGEPVHVDDPKGGAITA